MNKCHCEGIPYCVLPCKESNIRTSKNGALQSPGSARGRTNDRSKQTDKRRKETKENCMCSNLTEATVSNKEEKLIRKRRKVVDPTPRSWKRQAFISTRKCCKQANATIGVRNWKPYIGDDSMDEGLRIWQQLTRRRTTTAAPSRTTTATSSPRRAWREAGQRGRQAGAGPARTQGRRWGGEAQPRLERLCHQ